MNAIDSKEVSAYQESAEIPRAVRLILSALKDWGMNIPDRSNFLRFTDREGNPLHVALIVEDNDQIVKNHYFDRLTYQGDGQERIVELKDKTGTPLLTMMHSDIDKTSSASTAQQNGFFFEAINVVGTLSLDAKISLEGGVKGEIVLFLNPPHIGNDTLKLQLLGMRVDMDALSVVRVGRIIDISA